jgi:hypothetical protein
LDFAPEFGPEFAHALSAQADALRQSMKDFKIDPQQMDRFRQQMEELRKNFSQEQMKQFEQQMEQFRRQMEQWRGQSHGNFV